MMTKKQKLLVVQRVITPYRFDLLSKLAPYFEKISIISSYGEKSGANRAYVPKCLPDNVEILWHKAFWFPYKGESRSFRINFYPHSIIHLFDADVILCEGTTNIINNVYLIPVGKLLGKNVIWWDAGYSPSKRTFRRKFIDFIMSVLIGITDRQVAYSSKAKAYMKRHMNAKRCEVVLNTIDTDYFEYINSDVIKNVLGHKLDVNNINLLYVGAIEKRKKIDELLKILGKLSAGERKYSLTIIGDGDYLDECKKLANELRLPKIQFLGRIFDKEQLRKHYFNADLFVMPGDGGLGIAQSILFGLPAVCVSSDGTEYDYIDNHEFILDDIDELPHFLSTFFYNYDRTSVLSLREKLMDKKFIASMRKLLQA